MTTNSAQKMAAEQEVLADAKEEQGDEKENDAETEDKDVVKELPPKDEPATKPSEISVVWLDGLNRRISVTRRASGRILWERQPRD